jgi:hypothetical protein
MEEKNTIIIILSISINFLIVFRTVISRPCKSKILFTLKGEKKKARKKKTGEIKRFLPGPRFGRSDRSISDRI